MLLDRDLDRRRASWLDRALWFCLMVSCFGLCFGGNTYLARKSLVHDQIGVSGVMRYSARTVSAQDTQNVTINQVNNVYGKGSVLACVPQH